MGLVGIGNFVGGQTTVERLVALPGSNSPALAKCSGFDPTSGVLIPHGLVEKLNSGAAIGATIGEQTPFVFRQKDSSLLLLCRDSDEKIRKFDVTAGTWGGAGADTIAIIAASQSARLQHQVIFPTGGASAKLMVFEPEVSSGTEARPLGFRAPTGYDTDERPTVTQSAFVGHILYTCGSGAVDQWTGTAGAYTVDNSALGKDVFTLSDAAAADDQAFTKSLATEGGENLANFVYFEMCITIIDDQQEYDETGIFANDAYLFSSGYKLVLYSDTGCTPGNELATMEIPLCKPLGKVHRLVFHLGGATGTANGCAIVLASHFLAAESGKTYTLHLWSEGFQNDWSSCTNHLLPYLLEGSRSPWEEKLPPDMGTDATSAILLHRMNPDGEEIEPAVPKIQYCYIHRGIEARTASLLNPMHSNASEASAPASSLDPWRTNTVAISLPGTPTVIAEYGDYVTDAAIYHRVFNPYSGSGGSWGEWWYLKPIEIAASISWTDGRHACTLVSSSNDIAETGHQLVVGDALKFYETTGGVDPDLVYYCVTVVSANAFEVSLTKQGTAFVATATGSNSYRTVNEKELYPTIDWYDVPRMLEEWHDFPSSAQFAVVWNGRVIAGCLDWNSTDSEWKRPTAIMVGAYNKSWSFGTTVDPQTGRRTQGTELDGYAVAGSEMRALLARKSGVVVWLDNEFFWMVGNDPISGYHLLYQDAIGCISAKSVADCRSLVIWHAGDGFYAWAHGQAELISDQRVDSTLIDWTEPHNAVYSADRYILTCKYGGIWSYIIYYLRANCWEIRSATDSLELVGITTIDSAGAVYGVDPAGNALDLFGDTAGDYGYTTSLREVHTQYMMLCGPHEERQIGSLVLSAVTDQSAVDVDVTVNSQGVKTASESFSLTLTNSRTQYVKKLNLEKGDAVQVLLDFQSDTPPDIYLVGVSHDDTPVPRKGGDL